MNFNPEAFALQYHPQDAAREGESVLNTLMTPLNVHDRHVQRDEETAYRNREQSRAEKRDANTDDRDRIAQQQRAVELHGSSRRADQREQLYALQENRRQNEADLNRQHTANQEHEHLIADLHSAAQSRNPDAIQAAIEALQRAGYGAEEMQHNPPPPAMPDAAQAPPDTSTSAPGTAEATPAPPPLMPGARAALPSPESTNFVTASALDSKPAPRLPGKVPGWLSKAMADESASDQSLADPSRLAPDDPYRSIQ